MTAPVRIEAEAFADPRIELLGAIAGYNRYEALGRLAHLWRFCTERNSYVVSDAVISATLGDRGVTAIVQAELGDRATDGIRVRGTAGRIEWLEKKRKAAVAGGEANRQRLAGGKPSESHVAIQPAHSSASTRANGSHSDSHMASRNGASAEPLPSPLSLAPDLVIDHSDSHTRAPAHEGYTPTDRSAVDAWVAWTFRAVSDARVAVASEYAIANVLPFPMRVNMPSESRGCRDLRDRIRSEGLLAPSVCEQVVVALLAEARENKSVEWLSEKAFTEGGWLHAREATPGHRKPSKKPNGLARGTIGAATPRTDHGDQMNQGREVM